MVYFVQILYNYVFYHCPTAGMKKGDEASLSIILAGRAMLITLKPRCALVQILNTFFFLFFISFIIISFIIFYFFISIINFFLLFAFFVR